MPTIQIYVTDEEKEKYKELAKGKRVSFSEYIRQLIKDEGQEDDCRRESS